MRWLNSLRKCWQLLWMRSGDPVASAGCVVVRALVGGRWRQMRLLGRVGFHCQAESVDDPEHPCFWLLLPSDVAPEDVAQFERFYRGGK
jgi:hypothetical protein